MAEGNGARSVSCHRRNCALDEGNRARSAGSRRRYCAVRVGNRRRRNPWALNRGNFCCVSGQAGNRYRASCETDEVLPTVLAADGPGVPYRRRAVICRCGRYLAGVRSGFRSGRGQLQGTFQELERGQKRRARVGHHYGGQTCMGYRD